MFWIKSARKVAIGEPAGVTNRLAGGADSMSMRSISQAALVVFGVAAMAMPASAESFSINDAIIMAVKTNPSVGEAAANRRGIEAELHQNQGTLLPQVRLQASTGWLRTDERDVTPPPLGNNQSLPGAKGSIIVRQLLFDGFSSINNIWRQAARTDAAAARVHERGGLIALDAAEAYIDVVRYMRLVALAQEDVKAHGRILSNVQKRFNGGRAGEGDLEQTRERVDAAEAALTEFRRNLEDARAKFRNVVGVGPFNLRAPGRLLGLPQSKDEALAITLTHNPTIKAAQGDLDAARYAFHSTSGAFMPNVALEGQATLGDNEDTFYGRYNQESLQVVANWDIFTGGQNSWKRAEAAEQYTQASMAEARLQRAAYESVDQAWNARTITSKRMAQLQSQTAADRKVISAYSKEYDLGQRSLIDLLNAENQLFNAEVSLESARAVAVYGDYQLLAAMGKLLAYADAPHPVDAEPLVPGSFGLIPNKLPPILVHLPNPGPEPLNVMGPQTVPPINTSQPPEPPRPPAQKQSFSEQWDAIESAMAPSNSALGYASIFSPKGMSGTPAWPK